MTAAQDFQTRFLLDIPLIQAPMAGVSSPALAASVCNEGAIGSLGLGAMTVEGMQKAAKKLKDATSKPFNLNFFCHQRRPLDEEKQNIWLKRITPEFAQYGQKPPQKLAEVYSSFYQNDAMLKFLLDEKPAIASFHFGLPDEPAIRALKEKGIYLIASATSLEEACLVEKAGFDGVIAQGYEAGGHRGIFDENGSDACLGLIALLPLLVRHISIPVIAAGGIMNGQAIRAVLDMGAAAAQMGTAFIACPQSLADEHYRKRLASHDAKHTHMTRVISGRPARSLHSRFTEFSKTVPDYDVAPYPFAYDAAKQLHTLAKENNDFGYGAYWAGQGAPLSRALGTSELVKTLKQEFKQNQKDNHKK